MLLTEELQFIGRSSPVGCPAGYNYYLLVYGAAAAEPEKGGYRLRLRLRLACDADASFYGFATSAAVLLGGQTLWGWERNQLPGAYWGDSAPLTEAGILYPRWTELADREISLTAIAAGAELPLQVTWVMESALDRSWFPNTGEAAVLTQPVTLPPIPGRTEVSLSRNLVQADGSQSLTVTAKSPVPGVTFWLEAFMAGEQMIPGCTLPGKCSLTFLPEKWLPWIPNAADSTGLPDGEAPSLRVTTLDAGGNTLEIRQLRFDIAAPESCGPVIGTLETSPVSMAASPFDGMYIQGITRVQVRAAAAGQYGAAISGTTVTVEGRKYPTEGSVVTDYLSGFGTVKVFCTVTDTRGLSTTRETELQVVPYTRPVLGLDFCCRCDAEGQPGEKGRYLLLQATGSSCAVASEANPCCLELRMAAAPEDWQPLTEPLSQETQYRGVVENLILDPALGYNLQLRCRDALGGCTVTAFTVAPEEIYLHRTPKGLGIGKYVEAEKLVDCGWDLWLRGTLLLGDSGETLENYIKRIMEEKNGDL